MSPSPSSIDPSIAHRAGLTAFLFLLFSGNGSERNAVALKLVEALPESDVQDFMNLTHDVPLPQEEYRPKTPKRPKTGQSGKSYRPRFRRR